MKKKRQKYSINFALFLHVKFLLTVQFSSRAIIIHYSIFIFIVNLGIIRFKYMYTQNHIRITFTKNSLESKFCRTIITKILC